MKSRVAHVEPVVISCSGKQVRSLTVPPFQVSENRSPNGRDEDNGQFPQDEFHRLSSRLHAYRHLKNAAMRWSMWNPTNGVQAFLQPEQRHAMIRSYEAPVSRTPE